MPNYQNGKIYSIRSRSRPDLVYIGSTTQSLSRRLSKHKGMRNETTSKQIVGLGDAYIELIEECKCDNKDQLLRREGQIMRSMICVNRCIVGRTAVEYYQDNKERKNKYYTENKEEIDKKYKKYYQENKERILARKKQYYTENKERIALKEKQYRQENKDKIALKAKQNIDCECGSTICRKEITRHRRSKKHIHWRRIYEFIHS